METLSALPIFVGRCVVEEADAPSPTVHLSSTILGEGTFCTKRGQFALGQSVPRGHPALGQDVPGGILRGGTTCTTTPVPHTFALSCLP